MRDLKLLLEVMSGPWRDCEGSRASRGDSLSGFVENCGDDAAGFRGVTLIHHFSGGADVRGGGAHVGSNVRSPMRDVERVRFYEPYVAINSRAFVEPPFVLGGVDANDQNIFP